MRYNAPPTWPSPPVGWEPPAGWQPELTWPPAPEGWAFWVPEPGEASLPPVGFADPRIPAWDPRSVRGSAAVDPAAVSPESAAATGRAAWTLFLIASPPSCWERGPRSWRLGPGPAGRSGPAG